SSGAGSQAGERTEDERVALESATENGVTSKEEEKTVAIPERLPTHIVGYEILAELGRGGMSVVYQARQTHPDRLVALKMILTGSHSSAAGRARFLAEADAIARLRHPNIVQIYEVGQHDGLPFLSLEYVGGGSLAQKFRGPQPAREAAALVEM